MSACCEPQLYASLELPYSWTYESRWDTHLACIGWFLVSFPPQSQESLGTSVTPSGAQECVDWMTGRTQAVKLTFFLMSVIHFFMASNNRLQDLNKFNRSWGFSRLTNLIWVSHVCFGDSIIFVTFGTAEIKGHSQMAICCDTALYEINYQQEKTALCSLNQVWLQTHVSQLVYHSFA